MHFFAYFEQNTLPKYRLPTFLSHPARILYRTVGYSLIAFALQVGRDFFRRKRATTIFFSERRLISDLSEISSSADFRATAKLLSQRGKNGGGRRIFEQKKKEKKKELNESRKIRKGEGGEEGADRGSRAA